MAEVQSAVGATRREVPRNTVEETLRDVFLDGYELADGGVQESSYQV